MPHTTLYLDEEAESFKQILEKEGINLSGLFKEAMRKEIDDKSNAEILKKEIAKIEDEINELAQKKQSKLKKLDQVIKVDTEKLAAIAQVDPSYVMQMTKSIMKIYNVTETKAKDLAIDYLTMDESIRPTVQVFMQTKYRNSYT